MKNDNINTCSIRLFTSWLSVLEQLLSLLWGRSISLAVLTITLLLLCVFPSSVFADTTEPVIIIPGILGSAERNGGWVIDPIFHVYDDLISTLTGVGYVSSSTLFTFPYDWRKSNVDTAKLLVKKIEAVKNSCSCSKVNIIAHSMGGLVARSYAQSSEYANDIDKLIFLGTPHQGAPEDYLTWNFGQIKPSGISSWILNIILSHQAKENGYSNLFSYIHGYPIKSVEELLPIYNYLRFSGDDAPRPYGDGYTWNSFLQGINQVNNTVYRSGGIRVTNIVSKSDFSTLGVLDIPQADGYPTQFVNEAGDGTVPARSAEWGWPVDLYIDSSHIDLPTKSEKSIIEALFSSVKVENSSPLPPTKYLTFGNSETIRNVAQSFTVDNTLKLTDVHLYIKKASFTNNGLTITIVNDDNGQPGIVVIASSTTAYGSLTQGLYSWIDVPVTPQPILSPGVPYWIVVEPFSAGPSGYYVLAANANSFSLGQARIGNQSENTWYTTSPEGQSAYFKVTLVEPVSPISMVLRHIGRMLMATVFSPVDIMITAPDGRRIGRDPVTGQEVNEISDAFYSGFDSQDEFITIPDPVDGEYKIDTIGTGDGDFSVDLAQVTDNGEATTTISGTTVVNATSTFSVSLQDDLLKDTEPAIEMPIVEATGVVPEATSSIDISFVPEQILEKIPEPIPNRPNREHHSTQVAKVFTIAPVESSVVSNEPTIDIDTDRFIAAYREPSKLENLEVSKIVSIDYSSPIKNTASAHDAIFGVFHKIYGLIKRLISFAW